MSETTGTAVRTTERIRAGLHSLSPAERRVAEVVLRDPLEVIHLSVSELAALADTSPATVVRLCVSIGLRGYQELKITLASESIPEDRRVLGDIEPGDEAEDIVHKVLASSSRALLQASDAVRADALTRAAEHVMSARRVLFGAVGTSAPLAADAAYRMTTLGIDATFPSDVHVQHVSARMLGPGDVFFAISHTGSTFETLATARTAAASGATTIALTSFARSPLTDVVDLSLIAGSAETAYRVEAMTSRLVHLALLDTVFVLISLRHPQSAEKLARSSDVIVEHRI